MKQKKIIAISSIALVGLGGYFWLSQQVQTPIKKELSKATKENSQLLVKEKTVAKNGNDLDEDEEFNPYATEVLKANLQQVADIYEETSKYPTNSQPVFDPSAVREPAPFEFNNVDLPFPKDANDDSPLRIAAATDTHQYFFGDTIQARVQLSNAPTETHIKVSGVLSGAAGDIPMPLSFEANNGSVNEYIAQFDTNIAPANLMTSEMSLNVTVDVDGRELFTTTSFRFDRPSAQVIGVMPAQVAGSSLEIPLQIDVGQSGYYFASAVLEDSATRRPLLELQQEGRLQSGNALLNFKAHIAALKRQGSEGPYTLRSIKLKRGAEIGETLDSPGSSLQREFTVRGFPFAFYQEEEFVDPLAQERLAFLRAAGQVDEEQVRERHDQQQQEDQIKEDNPSLYNDETNEG